MVNMAKVSKEFKVKPLKDIMKLNDFQIDFLSIYRNK